MSCQLYWNFNEYSRNMNDNGEKVREEILTAPVTLSNVENNTLLELKGHLVLEIVKTPVDEIDEFQENYNIVYSIGENVIGSLYVVTYYTQPKSDGFETLLKNISGTVSCKGFLSQFNNGTAFIEFDKKTGKRCLTLYEKNSRNPSESKPVSTPLPNLSGNWTYEGSIFRRNNMDEKPDFNNIITIPPIPVIITQKDRFIMMEITKDITRPKEGFLLGSLTYVHNHWKLTFSDYDDNGVFNLNEISKNVWEGVYTESGFCGSREQFQTTGIITLKKL